MSRSRLSFLLLLLMLSVGAVQAQEDNDIMAISLSPQPSLYFPDWQLHKGLNISLSASAMVGLGRCSGSGFANGLSAMYADSLSSCLSFSLGGYLSRMSWRSRDRETAGLLAVLNYRFNERMEGNVFFQKNLASPQWPQPWPFDENFSERIGAEFRYHFNPSLSVGFSVWEERRRYPMFQ